jgi:hypothetical protein
MRFHKAQQLSLPESGIPGEVMAACPCRGKSKAGRIGLHCALMPHESKDMLSRRGVDFIVDAE